MITDEDIYAYLEHHGVKGMKWRKGRHPRSAAEEARRKKIFGPKGKQRLKAAAGTATVVGAVIATKLLEVHGQKKFSAAVRG